MAFIRTKRVKNGEYLYLVENRWKKRGGKVKQKTKKYLGRVYRFDRVNVMDFSSFYDIEDLQDYVERMTVERILMDLIKLELFNYGFEENQGIWCRGVVFFDLKNKRIYNKKNKGVAIALNDGFLTDYAIRKLLNFRADVEEDGYELAKMFVEAGLAVPSDIFVGYFNKTMKTVDFS